MTRGDAGAKGGSRGTEAQQEARRANAVKARTAQAAQRAAGIVHSRRYLATPEGHAQRVAQLAEAREKSTLAALQISRVMQAQEQAEAFILDNNLLAPSAQRGHVVGSGFQLVPRQPPAQRRWRAGGLPDDSLGTDQSQ